MDRETDATGNNPSDPGKREEEKRGTEMAKRFKKFISIFSAAVLLTVSVLAVVMAEDTLPETDDENELLQTSPEQLPEKDLSLVQEQSPVQNVMPAREDFPEENRLSGQEDVPPTENVPNEEQPSGQEDTPAPENVPEEEQPAGRENEPTQENVPEEEQPARQEEVPAQDIIPDEEQTSGEAETPAQEDVQEQEDLPAPENTPEEEQPSAQEVPQDHSPVQDDAVADGEETGLRFNGAVSGTFSADEPCTVAYYSETDGEVAFTLKLRGGADIDFFLDDTAVAAEETKISEGETAEYIYLASVQSGREYTIRMDAAAGIGFTLSAGQYKPETPEPDEETEEQNEAAEPAEEDPDENAAEDPEEATNEEEASGTRGWITAEPAEYRAGDTIVLHGATDPETEHTFSWLCSADGETWEKKEYGRDLTVDVTEENIGTLFCFRFGEDALSDSYLISVVPETEENTEDAPEQETAGDPAEDEELPEEERDITINVTFDTPNPVIGDTAHFSAVLTGYEQLTYTLQWQYSPDQTEWTDLPGETGETMDVVVTEENNTVFWRIVVDVEEDQEA